MRNVGVLFWTALGLLALSVAVVFALWPPVDRTVPSPGGRLPDVALRNPPGLSANAPGTTIFPSASPAAPPGDAAIDQSPLIPSIPPSLRDIAERLDLGVPPYGGTPSPVPTPRPPLTEAELFDRIWPPSYRAYLQEIETLDVGSAGPLVPPAERTASFATDANMYHSLNAVFKNIHRMGWMTDEVYAGLSRAVANTFPAYIERQRALLKSGQTAETPLPGFQRIAPAPNDRAFAEALVDGVSYSLSFIVPKAEAAWVTKGDCYKDDDPKYPILGFSVPEFCCNCGIKCYGYYCEYVDDCGTNGAACDYQLGCLNGVCQKEVWPNAIWDAYWYPASSLMCGCG